jgi:hypothetical protein
MLDIAAADGHQDEFRAISSGKSSDGEGGSGPRAIPEFVKPILVLDDRRIKSCFGCWICASSLIWPLYVSSLFNRERMAELIAED